MVRAAHAVSFSIRKLFRRAAAAAAVPSSAAQALVERGIAAEDAGAAGLHEADYNQAIALHTLGRLAEAVAGYRRALEIKPDFPDAEAMRTKPR